MFLLLAFTGKRGTTGPTLQTVKPTCLVLLRRLALSIGLPTKATPRMGAIAGQ